MSVNPITSFSALQEEWDSVLRDSPVASIFLSPEWQEVWWDSFSDDRQMTGFVVPAESGAADALASLSRLGGDISFVGATDTFDYKRFPGASGGSRSPFTRSCWTCWRAWEWDEVRLDSLVEHSPTLTYLPGLARERGYAVDVDHEDVTWGIGLPGDWDEYLALLSKKNRHELRRKLRRLDSQADWRWYCLTKPEEVEENFDDFLSLMRMSRPDKEEYMTQAREDFFRAMTRRMAELDRIRLFFMEIGRGQGGGQPVLRLRFGAAVVQ